MALLGAVFDSLSFFVTIRIIRSALKSQSPWSFVGHLSIDVIIAVIATFWVLWVFSFSSWLIRLTEPATAVLTARQELYQSRAMDALENPTDNVRNIYFGIIMGVSAMLPTCAHGYMAFRAAVLVHFPIALRIEGFFLKILDFFFRLGGLFGQAR